MDVLGVVGTPWLWLGPPGYCNALIMVGVAWAWLGHPGCGGSPLAAMRGGPGCASCSLTSSVCSRAEAQEQRERRREGLCHLGCPEISAQSFQPLS